MKTTANVDLRPYNTFGVTAMCDKFVELDTVEDALEWAEHADRSVPLLVIGGGRNLLLTQDFHGTVVRSAIRGREVTDETPDYVLVRCGSGEVWDDVVAWCVEHGWSGMENLSLIPGDVGATAVQNIGAYGVEAKDLIHSVEAVDILTGRMACFTVGECKYGYRDSAFKNALHGRYIITHVTYRMNKSFRPITDYGNVVDELRRMGISHPTLAQMRQVVIDIRKSKLPDWHVMGNAGSFFKNPVLDACAFAQLQTSFPDVRYFPLSDGRVKVPAGWLIEKCGWKGRRIGNVGVYERQSLVLVNYGNACGTEILALCNAIIKDVEGKFGIRLHPEVNIV